MGWLSAESLEVLRGAGYGTVQGAVEAGTDPGEAAVAVIDAAREISPELGMSEEQAALAAARGIMGAAEAVGGDALAAVRQALPDDLVAAEERSRTGEAESC